jgi:hypothetical protein
MRIPVSYSLEEELEETLRIESKKLGVSASYLLGLAAKNGLRSAQKDIERTNKRGELKK